MICLQNRPKSGNGILGRRKLLFLAHLHLIRKRPKRYNPRTQTGSNPTQEIEISMVSKSSFCTSTPKSTGISPMQVLEGTDSTGHGEGLRALALKRETEETCINKPPPRSQSAVIARATGQGEGSTSAEQKSDRKDMRQGKTLGREARCEASRHG